MKNIILRKHERRESFFKGISSKSVNVMSKAGQVFETSILTVK